MQGPPNMGDVPSIFGCLTRPFWRSLYPSIVLDGIPCSLLGMVVCKKQGNYFELCLQCLVSKAIDFALASTFVQGASEGGCALWLVVVVWSKHRDHPLLH
jgi:hypothetical protein